jgi:alpha-L-fucosidase
MADWMAHSREAVYDVDLDPPLPMLDKTDNPVTVRGTTWYAMPDPQDRIEIRDIARPESVALLRTGEPIDHTFEKGTLGLTVPEAMCTDLPDMVKITFPAPPAQPVR